jgi:hypothetical protein
VTTDAEAAFGEPAGARKLPSAYWYWLALPIAVLGIGIGIWWFVHGFTTLGDKVERLERVPVPGQRTVTLSEGAQSIYFESGDGQDVAVPELRIRIVPEGGGAPLAVRNHDGSATYSIDGYDGQSVYGFDAPREGRYTVKVSARTESLPASPVLALGEGIGGHILGIVLGGLGFIFGGLLAAGGWLIAVAVRRRRAGV